MDTRWHLATDMNDWLTQALNRVHLAEGEALAQRGAFHIVLAGGGTPRLLYEALAREPHDWPHWHIWLGDERCLPPDDPDRNSTMVQASLLKGAPIPLKLFHIIPAEYGAQTAARKYAASLAGIGHFDLVLLGLGEDGHTASLFPGHEWGTNPGAPDALPILDAPKPPPQRVSLSAHRLAQSHRVLFLVTGAGKQEAVARWRRGEPIPASAIQPNTGVDVLLTTESCPPGERP
jgi:6-phosphogluconolactonase